MLNLNQSFQDVHGNVYPAAVVIINHVNFNCQEQASIQSQVLEAGEVTYTPAQVTNHRTVSFSAWLYKDAQALADMKQPMPLRNSSGQEHFHFQADETVTVANAVASCEQWVLDNIINSTEVEQA